MKAIIIDNHGDERIIERDSVLTLFVSNGFVEVWEAATDKTQSRIVGVFDKPIASLIRD